MLLLALSRGLAACRAHQPRGAREQPRVGELAAGCGTVGWASAVRVVALGRHSAGEPLAGAAADPRRLLRVLPRVPAVADSLPLTDATARIFDAATSAALPAGALFVNATGTPRRGRLGGAGRDVFATEPARPPAPDGAAHGHRPPARPRPAGSRPRAGQPAPLPHRGAAAQPGRPGGGRRSRWRHPSQRRTGTLHLARTRAAIAARPESAPRGIFRSRGGSQRRTRQGWADAGIGGERELPEDDHAHAHDAGDDREGLAAAGHGLAPACPGHAEMGTPPTGHCMASCPPHGELDTRVQRVYR